MPLSRRRSKFASRTTATLRRKVCGTFPPLALVIRRVELNLARS
jgi:hypothetical protein